jgi:glycosyltransferase involved in cell wall biosynthesis
MNVMKIAVIMPAYNEAKRLAPVLARLPKVINGHEVLPIVVDDGSRDATSKVAKSASGITVIRHQTNLGKGAAVKTGCDAAYLMGADIFVLMDTDGQHRPEDVERIVAPLLEKPGDLVIGTRPFSAKMPAAMRLGNHVLYWSGRLLFGIDVRDSQSGYRAFSRDTYPLVRWASPNYAMESEMLILAARHKVQFAEVEIETIYLDNHKGTTPLDGLRILATLLKWRLLWFREYSSLEPFSL